MRCPFCDTDNDKVVDSRSSEGGQVIRRRRECMSCERRFTTYERAEETAKLAVVKKDGTRIPYDKEKMLTGLQKACFKRAVPTETLQELVDEVDEYLFRKYDREVDSVEIGRLLSDRLKQIDQVAYVRYASVYKQFRDIEDFFDEVKEVIASKSDIDVPDQGKLF